MANRKVKAPKGYHFMKTSSGLRLMKHTGRYKPHKGASLTASIPVIKTHRS